MRVPPECPSGLVVGLWLRGCVVGGPDSRLLKVCRSDLFVLNWECGDGLDDWCRWGIVDAGPYP